MVHCKHKPPNSTNYEFHPPMQVHRHNITPKSYTNLNESNLVKGLFHHQSCDTIIPSSRIQTLQIPWALNTQVPQVQGYINTKIPCLQGYKTELRSQHIDARESRGGKKPNNDVRSFSNGGGDRRDVATTFMDVALKFGKKEKEIKKLTSLQVRRSNLTQPFGSFQPKKKMLLHGRYTFGKAHRPFMLCKASYRYIELTEQIFMLIRNIHQFLPSVFII